MTRIAIIGAGVAGLTTAYGLRTQSIERTVFEKSRGYGGRAATRGRHGCRYDYGAPFFTAPSRRVRDLVGAHLPADQLIEVGRPVGAFNRDGDLVRRREHAGGSLWTYYHGISTLGKLLARFGRAEIRRETRVERLRRKGGRWAVQTESGAVYEPYDAVVLTPPAPQTADILARPDLIEPPYSDLHEAVAAVDYAPQFAYVLAYDRPISRPGPYHGFVSQDSEHPLSWIGFEHDKPGHAPEGTHLLVVHTAPGWTQPRVDRDPDSFLPEVRAQVESVLSTSLSPPTWTDAQRWRYARPTSAVSEEARATAEEGGLYLAGDFVAGTGEVGAAIETGFAAADRIRSTEADGK
jgi:predicted NAD/FAD-dependent oxidoreductase